MTVVLLFSRLINALGIMHKHSLIEKGRNSANFYEPMAHKELLDGGIIIKKNTKKTKMRKTSLAYHGKGKELKTLLILCIDMGKNGDEEAKY